MLCARFFVRHFRLPILPYCPGLILVSLLTLGNFGCGVALDPDVEGFPCNSDGKCDFGLICVDGKCVRDACIDVRCESGSQCVLGNCYPKDCEAFSCSDGEICKDEECVDVDCIGTDCERGFVCHRGECIAACIIGGQAVPSGKINPQRDCLACVPEDNDSGWTPLSAGEYCESGLFCVVSKSCDGRGNCVGGAPRDCSHLDTDCALGFCDESAGGCVSEPVPEGTPCSSGGVCDGDGNCSAKASCDLPWGDGAIEHGQSVQAYQTSSVPFGHECNSEVRVCDNGVLSGSFGHEACFVAGADDCALPWGGTLAHGEEIEAFQYDVVGCGLACPSQNRRCTNTVLSGSYTYPSCEDHCSDCDTVDLTWGPEGCEASFQSISHGGKDRRDNSRAGRDGSATFTCDDGDWSFVSGDCELHTYFILTDAGRGGSVTPVEADVAHGETVAFQIEPDADYEIYSVIGCDGTLSGSTFTTAPIEDDCILSILFCGTSHNTSCEYLEFGQKEWVEYGDRQQWCEGNGEVRECRCDDNGCLYLIVNLLFKDSQECLETNPADCELSYAIWSIECDKFYAGRFSCHHECEPINWGSDAQCTGHP